MFYGWKIIGVSFVTHFISVGFAFYSYSVFFKALTVEFGASRFGVSLGLAIMNVAMALFASYLGRAVDLYSIRKIMMGGAVAMTIGFFIASQITALWQFYIVLGTFTGIGAAMIGLIPNAALVSNWFVRRRGMALGIATMGVSLSGLIMAPLSTYLIASLGWRETFMVYGCVTAGIVLPLTWFMVVSRPEDMNLLPDGDAPGSPEALALQQSETHTEFSAHDTLRDRNFWSIVVTVGFSFCCMGAILTHMIPHVTDLGFSAEKAALVLSASAGVGILGKLLFGWITDHIDTRIAYWIALGFQAAGVVVLLNVSSYGGLLAAAGIFGFGMGGIVPLWGSLLGEHFGRECFGRVMGLMTPCMLPIQIGGVPLAGYIYDQTESYAPAYKIFLGIYVLAVCALATLRPKRANDSRPAPAVAPPAQAYSAQCASGGSK